MEFKLKDFHYNTSDEELLDDLRTAAYKLGRNNITSRDYDEIGKYTSGTIHRRFGTWNKALQRAGLEVTLVQNQNISDKDLFENMEKIWIRLGQQPTYRDIQPAISLYSTHQYLSKFGTWRKALEAFVEFINTSDDQNQEIEKSESEEDIAEVREEKEIFFKHKTKRIPSERLKVQVLIRDGNKCRLCGVTVTGENIHFDHVLAWSKGGETVLENMQVLCELHNLAKGNLEYDIK